MIPNLTENEILALRAMLRSRLADGGSEIPESVPHEPLQLQLVRSRDGWSNSYTGDSSGQTGISLAEVLAPGDDDADNPSDDSRTDDRIPITGVTSPDKVEVDYSAEVYARLAVGMSFALHAMNTPYDDGEHYLRSISLLPNSTNPTSISLRLRRDLVVPTTPIAGYVVLKGAWGWNGNARLMHVVQHARHDIGVVARVGPEWVQLCRGQCRGLLVERLDAATVSGGAIIPSTAKLVVAELNESGLLVPATNPATGKRVVITVKNYDENVSAAAFTLAYAIQFGPYWECIPSCSPSAVTHSDWEPN